MAKKKEETTEEVVENQEVTEEVVENQEVTEEVVGKSVTLIKDGVSFTLSDPIMISAFENQGYEVEE
ncbi:TPA: hypothetical protein ACJ7FJ_001366 [Streptococcus pyogenes]